MDVAPAAGAATDPTAAAPTERTDLPAAMPAPTPSTAPASAADSAGGVGHPLGDSADA
jgi:hypothetical protein